MASTAPTGSTPKWCAADEFAYYSPDVGQLRAQLARQREWRDEAYWAGLATARALDVGRCSELDGRVVLDLGAGEGLLAHALATHFGPAAVWAVDAVPTQLWAAAATSKTTNVHFVVADGRKLPFPDGSFDLVLCNLFLHHIPDRGALLAEIRRVLRPGASLRAFEPNLLVNWVARHPGSRNERPLLAWDLASQARPFFAEVRTRYWWVRLATDRLGPLSPGFVLQARRSNDGPTGHPPDPIRFVRTGVGELLIDPELEHQDLARRQLDAVHAAAADGRLGDLPGVARPPA